MIVWGAIVICHRDVLVCYVLIGVVNLIHCLVWIIRGWPESLPKDLEHMYNKLFKPLQVTRAEFKDLTCFANIKELSEGETFAVEGSTKIGDMLSVLLKGRYVLVFIPKYKHI